LEHVRVLGAADGRPEVEAKTAAIPINGGPVLRDRYGRALTYLRVSVTERCNLRCFYCLPRDCTPPRVDDRLQLDEIAEIVRVGARLGINKVRITGGEPLVRRGVVDFVRALNGIPGIDELALSTNGTLLAAHAAALRNAGLRRVNVSLDSLRPAVFRSVSGRDDLQRVLDGIATARQVGLHPVKINVVVMRGVNDDELPAMLDYARDADAQVRFIEYMPLGMAQKWTRSYVACGEILERIRPHLADEPARRQPGDTATYYALRAGGEVGVISPVSCRFCDLCNRLRLTADGKLRPCLTADGEVDLRPCLRPTLDPAAIGAGFVAAVQGRPPHGAYTVAAESRSSARPMVAIGG
jgi:cyclic pyranopterin phosphate synthase